MKKKIAIGAILMNKVTQSQLGTDIEQSVFQSWQFDPASEDAFRGRIVAEAIAAKPGFSIIGIAVEVVDIGD